MNSNDKNLRQQEYFYSMLNEEEKKTLKYMPTVNELLDFTISKYCDLPAISNGVSTYTYGDLYNRVAKRRGYLNSLGLEFGQRVAIISPNTIDAMELYLAIVTNGLVSVFLPSQLDENSLAGMCKKFDVSALFYDKVFDDKIKNVDVPCYTTDFENCKTDIAPMKNVEKSTICSICLTGGTTGIPKGAIMTHGAIMRGALNGCFIPNGVLHQRYIALLPLSHIFGLVKGFLSCLYTGGLIFECTDMKKGFGMIPVIKPTTLVVVPGMAEIIANLTKLKGKGYSASIKSMVIGAAPVAPKLMSELDSMGITVLAGYGLTEGANLTSGNKDVMKHPDSMGMIYPEQEYKIVGGELRIKGDNLMLGYFGDSKATEEAFDKNGFLRTGDLVEVDDEGLIYIVGRIKNLIILANGENVSPEELEKTFYKIKYVKDCLVKEDTLNGKKVIGIEILPDEFFVKGMTDEEINELFDKILNQVNSTLPSYKQISTLKIRKEDFKRTGAMKIARN